jgi:hypothetical protein
MAIKGKRKSKSRPPARAPRRMPVQAPVPFARRRWVQVTAAAILGAAVVMLVVWVTNGIRASNAQEKADAAAAEQTRQQAEQRTAASQWKSTVETAMGGVANIPQQGTPVVAKQAADVLDALANGDAPPQGAAKTLEDLQTQAAAAAKTIKQEKLTEQISDKGFDLATTEYLIRSQEDLSNGLSGVAGAVALGSVALDAGGAQAAQLATAAKAEFDRAQALIDDAWRAYENALAAAGLVQPFAPPGGTSGVPSGFTP